MNQMKSASLSKSARITRIIRKIHRISGLSLILFFLIVAVTFILLGWKKHSGDLLQPRSYSGKFSGVVNCLPVDSLLNLANNYLLSTVSSDLSTETERIDIRPGKGMVKFVYARHYHEVQLNLSTGELLHIGYRTSDLVENIHDGSILDRVFGTGKGQIKLVYTSLMGFSLLSFIFTGFWLWYVPRRMRYRKIAGKNVQLNRETGYGTKRSKKAGI